MNCWIYKGARKDETYLFLAAPDETSEVPDALLEALGALELVMEIELTPERRLARADPVAVIRSLRSCGYYLQMPPPPERLSPRRGPVTDRLS